MMLLAVINWHSCFFLLFSLLACFFALAVLFCGNIVRMAFYLTLSLGATAGLFFLAGAHFVGAMQLMIYVGGTLVLLVFGVMLTAQARFVSLKTQGGDWVLASIVGGSLLALLVSASVAIPQWQVPHAQPEWTAGQISERTTTQIGMGLVAGRVDRLEQKDELLRAGMSSYLLPFEIVAMHLLVVLIGAAYLARAKRRIPGSAPVGG